MHDARWPFLISQVLLVLSNHQKEFAVRLALERSCSPEWCTFVLTLGVVHSHTTICVFLAHLPKEIVVAWFGTKACNVFKKHFAAYGLVGKFYTCKVIKNQSNEKLPSGQDLKGWMAPSRFSPHV